MSEYMTRRELREHTFKILFEAEFCERHELEEQQKLYFSQVPEIQRKDEIQIENKMNRILDHIEDLDRILNEVSRGWKTSRMNKVDLAILRLASYEILLDDSIPNAVAVNEAVELGKNYSGDDAAAFINGVLAAVVRKKESMEKENDL